MQRRSDLTLLCCLLQTTVIAACALSSICRSLPPFREMLVSRSFPAVLLPVPAFPQDRRYLPFVLPVNSSSFCLSGQTSFGYSVAFGDTAFLIRHG